MTTNYHACSKAYWSWKIDAAHRYSDEGWLKKYANELLVLVPSGETLLDVGCGSCQLTTYMAPVFDQVYAIDFSTSMLAAAAARLATFGITNVHLAFGLAQKIPCKAEAVNAIISNGVVQYLSNDDCKEHLRECYRVLNEGGIACIGLIPNANLRLAYYFRNPGRSSESLIDIVKQCITILGRRQIARLRKDVLWDGIGHWYSMENIITMAKEAGFVVDLRHSWYYEYRFHAILRKES